MAQVSAFLKFIFLVFYRVNTENKTANSHNLLQNTDTLLNNLDETMAVRKILIYYDRLYTTALIYPLTYISDYSMECGASW